MKFVPFLVVGLGACLLATSGHAQLTTIDPDNYPNATVLTHASPWATLSSANANNEASTFFTITATAENFPGYAPTGSNVFGVSGVNFFNNDQRLRIDFSQPTDLVSLAFGGGNFFSGETAHLDAYGSNGNLLASYISQPRLGGSFETLTLTRANPDIAWAVAYLPSDGGSFARFDRLQFNAVPEPSGFAFAMAAAGVLFARKRR